MGVRLEPARMQHTIRVFPSNFCLQTSVWHLCCFKCGLVLGMVSDLRLGLGLELRLGMGLRLTLRLGLELNWEWD